jgi:hypothetical protein
MKTIIKQEKKKMRKITAILLITAMIFTLTACGETPDAETVSTLIPDVATIFEDAGINFETPEVLIEIPPILDFTTQEAVNRLETFQSIGTVTIQDLRDMYGEPTGGRDYSSDGVVHNMKMYVWGGVEAGVSIRAFVFDEDRALPYSEQVAVEMTIAPCWRALINSSSVNLETLETKDGYSHDFVITGFTYNDFKAIGGSDGTVVSHRNGIPYHYVWYDGFENLIAAIDTNGNVLYAYRYNFTRSSPPEERWAKNFHYQRRGYEY